MQILENKEEQNEKKNKYKYKYLSTEKGRMKN